ncbi:MAG TPA: YceI family protein [Fibrobacteria bacterium]|nr:YceI family protein [Fibrobacteria bacterium]
MRNPAADLAFPSLFLVLMAIPPQAVQADEIGPMRPYICDSSLSTVTYKAIHPFATVRGVSRAPACTVWVDPDTVAFRVRVSVPARSFKSGLALRDSHAMKAVEADKYPRVEFTSNAVTPEDGKVGPYSLAGELTFHGETRPVSMAVTPRLENGKALIRGAFPVSLAAYKVKPPSLMMNRVKDTVTLSFDLAFDLPPAK